MNNKRILKQYWFVIFLGLGLIVYLVYFGIQTYKARPIFVNAKDVDGKSVVYSIDNDNYFADDLFDDLSENYGTTAAYFKWSMDVINAAVETTDEITTYANNYMQTIQYYNDEATIVDYLIQYGYPGGMADLEKYSLDMAKGDQLYADFYKKNFDTYAPYAIEGLKPKKVSHILVKVANVEQTTDESGNTMYTAKPTADEKAKLDAVTDAIKTGYDFSAIAAEYSDDTGNAKNGGYLGINTINTAASTYVKPFADAVIAQDFDTISKEPIVTEYGYHFIKIETPTNDELKNDGTFLREMSSFYTYANIKAVKEKSDELGFVIKDEGLIERIEGFILLADEELANYQNTEESVNENIETEKYNNEDVANESIEESEVSE